MTVASPRRLRERVTPLSVDNAELMAFVVSGGVVGPRRGDSEAPREAAEGVA